jgi:hypothetical protein
VTCGSIKEGKGSRVGLTGRRGMAIGSREGEVERSQAVGLVWRGAIGARAFGGSN